MYLDSASSSEKPQRVLDAMDRAYREYYANVHRGVYTIAEEATTAYEGARTKLACLSERVVADRDRVHEERDRGDQPRRLLVGARQPADGDAVVLTQMEHHANIVPWHMLAAERGVELRWIPLTADYRLDLSDLDRLLDGAKLLDGHGGVERARHVRTRSAPSPTPRTPPARASSSTPRRPSRTSPSTCRPGTPTSSGSPAHKMLGPSGIGGLWARAELLEAMPPFLGGGEMIRDVTVDGFTTNEIPWKFEAGTPPIAEVDRSRCRGRLPDRLWASTRSGPTRSR